METTTTIEDHVKEFILETYMPDASPDQLTESTHLVEAGIIDSIRVLSLVEFMEEEYNIMIEPQDLFRLISVTAIAEVIREKSEA